MDDGELENTFIVSGMFTQDSTCELNKWNNDVPKPSELSCIGSHFGGNKKLPNPNTQEQ